VSAAAGARGGPTLRLALAGDTMLGRGVAARLAADPDVPLVADDVAAVAREADLFIANLECCLSDRGAPVASPGKPFFFRGPPAAAGRLAQLGVDAVTLANNHAMDFGPLALLDTLDHLRAAGIAVAGAGADEAQARRPAVLTARGVRVRLVAAGDHPAAFAAGPDQPGIAYADLRRAPPPPWLRDASAPGADADVVLVAPHWGPNMQAAPVPHVRRAAAALARAGATLIAGHSAHVPQGPSGRVLFDLGDFLDDYAVDPVLRNDLGLLWLVTLGPSGPVRIEAVPLRLAFGVTRRASEDEARTLLGLMAPRCAAVGSRVRRDAGRFVFGPAPSAANPQRPARAPGT
jgi:poly-gamma-glutamate synthesis protein (capsule biosynthesis protein)